MNFVPVTLWVQMIDLYLVFLIGQGTLHCNQIILGETRK